MFNIQTMKHETHRLSSPLYLLLVWIIKGQKQDLLVQIFEESLLLRLRLVQAEERRWILTFYE